MDQKAAENQHGHHCSAQCNKCNGACSLNDKHNGQHRCSGGHNWS